MEAQKFPSLCMIFCLFLYLSTWDCCIRLLLHLFSTNILVCISSFSPMMWCLSLVGVCLLSIHLLFISETSAGFWFAAFHRSLYVMLLDHLLWTLSWHIGLWRLEFLPRDAMHKCGLCHHLESVHLSVCYVPVFCQNE